MTVLTVTDTPGIGRTISLSGLEAQGRDYPTRADAIAALPLMDTGTTFTVGDLTFIKDGNTSIPDMPGAAPANPFAADVGHFRAGTTVALNDAAMAAAVAWLNAADYRTLKASGVYTISAALPAITGRGKTLDFIGATLTMSGGVNGKFLIVGATGVSTVNFNAEFGDVNVSSTCPDDDFAFDFVNVTTGQCRVTRTNNLGSIARFGGDIADNKLKTFRFIMTYGSSNNSGGNSENLILMRNGTNVRADVNYSAGIPGNLNANGALVRVKPIAGGIVDTFTMANSHMQMYSVDHAGTADGRPYGLDVDMTDAKATNVWMTNDVHFDHTTTAAVRVRDAVGSTDDVRVFSLAGLLRLTIDAGEGIVIDKQSPNTVVWEGFDLGSGRYSSAGTGAIVKVSGDGMIGCHMSDAVLAGFSATKARAIDVGADGWTFTGNTIGRNTTGASMITAGIEITDAGIVDTLIANNHCDADIATQIVEPTYTTQDKLAPRRFVQGVGEVRAQAIMYPNFDDSVNNITSTTLPGGRHPIIRVNVSGTATINDITTPLPQLAQYTIINISSSALTINHATGKIRNNSGAAVVLGQHQSATYVRAALGGATWQQIGGKV